MTVGTKKMSSMIAQIILGKKKADSHLVTNDEDSQTWDDLAADHKKLMAKNPGAHVEIPNDPDV